jgi:hypothetical protein
MEKLETNLVLCDLRALDLVLGNGAGLVFHFDLQVFRGHNFGGKVQDPGQLASGKPVVRIVIRNPCLKKARLLPPHGSAAIDESLHHMPHLGHVEIGGDRIPVWQYQADVLFRMGAEVFLEGAQVHAIIGICS